MGKPITIGLGVGAGIIWSFALLWLAAHYVQLPVFALMPTIMTAFFAPGLVMAVMMAVSVRQTWRDYPAGDIPPATTGGTLPRVIYDTACHLVLGLCIWPAAAVLLGGPGPGVIAILGAGLAVSRVVFWIGCYWSVGLRTFGLVSSLGPTLMVAIWALWILMGRF
ncbi:hypothetical protein O4H61_00980 [Roseovarius aestuarii]|nr:hypothetical protein [Roseovarius aestuarii]